jgi:hypothetical protein
MCDPVVDPGQRKQSKEEKAAKRRKKKRGWGCNSVTEHVHCRKPWVQFSAPKEGGGGEGEEEGGEEIGEGEREGKGEERGREEEGGG